MKKLLVALAVLAASTAASAQVSFTISDSGFGRITLGESISPDVVYQQPQTVFETYQTRDPVYVRVPTEQQQNWSRYCNSYNLCNQPVYFVQESWYQNETRRNDDFVAQRDAFREHRRNSRADHTHWVSTADEGQTFSLNGTATVRYGANGAFVQRNVTNNGSCTNSFFGRDPIPGVKKGCDVLTRNSRDARRDDFDYSRTYWADAADEGQTFSLNGTATVRYGANGSFVQRNVTDNGSCTNSFFGRDPIPGVKKGCQVLTSK